MLGYIPGWGKGGNWIFKNSLYILFVPSSVSKTSVAFFWKLKWWQFSAIWTPPFLQPRLVTFQDGGGTEWAIGSLRASPLFPFLAEISLHGSQSKYQRNSITQVDKYTQFRIQFKHSTKVLYLCKSRKESYCCKNITQLSVHWLVTKNGPHGLYMHRLCICNRLNVHHAYMQETARPKGQT